MYSVLRVWVEAEQLAAAEAIGEAMNVIRPGVYDGLRPARDGFACSVLRSPSWADHRAAIETFLTELAEPLARARSFGARLVVDVAIDRKDREHVRFFYSVHSPLELLTLLVHHGVALELSFYSPRPRDLDDSDDE